VGTKLFVEGFYGTVAAYSIIFRRNPVRMGIMLGGQVVMAAGCGENPSIAILAVYSNSHQYNDREPLPLQRQHCRQSELCHIGQSYSPQLPFMVRKVNLVRHCIVYQLSSPMRSSGTAQG
jgi:hypothetical protein